MYSPVTEYFPYIEYSHKNHNDYIYHVGYRYFVKGNSNIQEIFTTISWKDKGIPLNIVNRELRSIPIEKGVMFPVTNCKVS